MKSFTVHRGRVAPLDRINVDTDQIIPKQFLKRIERTGFGQFLFYDWRFGADGKKSADFVLDEPRYEGASILVAGKNFGCGSSREHAVWALADFGFRAVIARPSPTFSPTTARRMDFSPSNSAKTQSPSSCNARRTLTSPDRHRSGAMRSTGRARVPRQIFH